MRLPLASTAPRDSDVAWGPFRVDLVAGKVWVDRMKVAALEPLPLRILAHLVASAGRVCSHAELFERVLGIAASGQSKRLDRAVHVLRAKVGKTAAAHIVNVKGVGFGVGIDDRGRPVGTNS